MDLQGLIESYPKANFVVSRAIEGKEHIVLVDERPEHFAVEMINESDLVLFILPAHFNTEMLSSSLFALIISEVVIFGKVILGDKSRKHTLKMFFQYFLSNCFLKPSVSKRKLLRSLKNAANYLGVLSKAGVYNDTDYIKQLLIDFYFPCTSNFLAVNRSVFIEWNVPDEIYAVLNCNLDTVTVLKLNDSVQAANKYLEDSSVLLYYVELQNDYDDIVIDLLKYCKTELNVLVEKSALFFWSDEDSQMMKIKVNPSKSEYKNTLQLLGGIDMFLKENFQKGIKKFTAQQLYLEQEKYLQRNNKIKEFEGALFDISVSVFRANYQEWSSTIRGAYLSKCMSILLSILNEDQRGKFTRLLFSNLFSIDNITSVFKSFNDYENNVNSKYRQLKHRADSMRGAFILDVDTENKLRSLFNNIIANMRNENRELELMGVDKLIYIQKDYIGKDKFLFLSLVFIFEKLATHLGLDREEQRFSAFVLKSAHITQD